MKIKLSDVTDVAAKYFVLLFCCLLTFNVFAQQKKEVVQNLPAFDRKPYHFGFTIGINRMNFGLRLSDNYLTSNYIYGVRVKQNVGFHLGPISNFRIGNLFDFRALLNLSFNNRTLTYTLMTDTVAGGGRTFKDYDMVFESTFIEFPLLLKYKSLRHNNHRHYLVAGFTPKYDMNARKPVKQEELPKFRLHTLDVYYELGYGVDFYLTYFKFAMEIKYCQGLRNTPRVEANASQQQFTDVIDAMSSRMLMLSLHFE